jgi:hypothetical protein
MPVKPEWKHIAFVVGGLYLIFVAFDSWRAYQTPTGTASRWNFLARAINWRVQAHTTQYTPLNSPPGAGNDWSYAWNEVQNQST